MKGHVHVRLGTLAAAGALAWSIVWVTAQGGAVAIDQDDIGGGRHERERPRGGCVGDC